MDKSPKVIKVPTGPQHKPECEDACPPDGYKATRPGRIHPWVPQVLLRYTQRRKSSLTTTPAHLTTGNRHYTRDRERHFFFLRYKNLKQSDPGPGASESEHL